MLAGFLLYSAGAFYLWRQIRPVYMPRGHALMNSLLILPAALGNPLYQDMNRPYDVYSDKYEYLEKKLETSQPWRLVIGYNRYQDELAEMNNLLIENGKVPPLKNLHDA